MPDETRTFDGAIEAIRNWARLRVEGQQAKALIQHCLAVHRSPNADPEIWHLWETFVDKEQIEIKERLECQKWHRMDGHNLEIFRTAFVNVRIGRDSFLPANVSNLFNEDGKTHLFFWYLLLLGAWAVRDPFYYLRPAAYWFIGGQLAEKEIAARCSKHPEDIDGGMMIYLHLTGANRIPEVAALISSTEKTIAKSIRQGLPNGTRQFLSEGTMLPLNDAIAARVAKTLFLGFSGSPEDILARSYSGKLGVKTAAKNDIIDELRAELPKPIAKLLRKAGKIKRKAKKAGRELSAKEKELLEAIPDEIDSINDQIASALAKGDFAIENGTPDANVSVKSRMEEFEKEHPKEWAIIEAIKIKDVSNKELAQRNGVSEARISQRLVAALATFHKFLEQ